MQLLKLWKKWDTKKASKRVLNLHITFLDNDWIAGVDQSENHDEIENKNKKNENENENKPEMYDVYEK